MPIPINPTFYEPGAGGIPTTNNPIAIGGRAEDYEHSITAEIGFDSMRCSFLARSFEEAIDWANRLISSCVVFDPDGGKAWEGFLYEVEIAWGSKRVAVSLGDMANKIRVKYNDQNGQQTSTTSVTSAASIARYGTKERAINFSTANATAAANRANIVLGQIAWPRSKRSSSADTGSQSGGIRVTLGCRGWWYALDWILTSSASTATTTTTTQVSNLIAAYNGTNAFFSTSAANITASGVSDTEKIEDETSYEEQITKLLASGTGTQRLVWGIYEDRALTVAIWAGASPSTITYYESDRDRTIRDAQGNIIAPWRLRPDAMAQLVDLIEPAPASGPIDTLTRRYIKRVSCRISSGGVSAELEADDVDSLEEILTHPAGGSSSGVSDRQNKIERKIARPARTRFSGTNGTVDVGGGTITNTGGGIVDVGTGAGIGGAGSSGVSTSGGTPGRVPEWATASTLQDSTLIKSGAGVLTLSSSGAFTLTVPATGTAALGTGSSGRVAEWAGTNTVQASTLAKTGAGVLTLTSGATTLTLTLSGGSGQIDFTTPTTGDALIYDGTKFTPTAAPSGNGTTGRVAKWTSATALGADTLAKTGAGILTLTSGATTLTLTLSGGSATLDFSTPTSGDVLAYNGTIFTPTAPTVYAPTNATYIVQTANGTLSAEQVLASLATGFMKVTTTTGVITSQADISLTADVIGTLPIANGGTGATTAPTAIAALGGLSGNGLAGQIAVYTGTLSVSSFSNFTFNDTTNVLTVTGSVVAAENSAFGSASKPTSTRLLTKGSGTSSATKSLQAQDSGATEHMYVRDDGQLGARVAWTIFSDRRLKQNIRDIETGLAKNVLKIIQDLPDPVLFDYTSGAPDQIGYLADELQAVLPQIVQTITPDAGVDTPADLLGVQYTNLIPIMLLGLKQLIPLVSGAESRANSGPRPNRPRLR